MTKEINPPWFDTLKHIGQTVAPDGRVTLFDVECEEVGNRLVVSGKVLDEAQRMALMEGFPEWDLDLQVQVYPFDLPDTPACGMVKVPLLNLRAEPRHAAELVSQVLMNDELQILDTRKDWLKVRSVRDGYVAWAQRGNILLGDLAQRIEWLQHEFAIATSHVVLLYRTENPDEIVSRAYLNTRLMLTGEQRSGCREVILPDARTAWVRIEDIRPDRSISRPASNTAHFARSFLGVPYLWGGTSPVQMDCSGFVQMLYRWAGKQLPRDADQQQAAGEPVPSITDLVVSDLVFFPGHVGLYMGLDYFIHATAGRGGVWVNSFDPNDPAYDPWYRDHFEGGARFFD